MSLQVAKLDCTRRKDNSDYLYKKVVYLHVLP
jgi:hypothetical protein